MDEEKEYRIKAKEMIIKPNKETGQKGVFEEIDVEFDAKSRDIFFVNKHGATSRDKLQEIRYVTKNMMVLELVMATASSKVLKLLREEDVINWMKPIVEILKS